MKSLPDQELAQRYVELRQHSGHFSMLPKKHRVTILSVHGGMLALAIILQNISPDNPITWLIFGSLLGHYALLWKIRKTSLTQWQFTERIINWELIHQLANPAETSPPPLKEPNT